MSNPVETNTRELPGYSGLSAPDQLAIRLKAERKTVAQIAAALKESYDLERSPRTVEEWFGPDGRLQQGYTDWCDAMGRASVSETISLIQRNGVAIAAKALAKTNSPDEAIATRAIFGLLNKIMPDAAKLDLRVEEVPWVPESIPEGLQASIDRQRAIIEAGEAALAAKETANG